jgi:hypothetical protein
MIASAPLTFSSCHARVEFVSLCQTTTCERAREEQSRRAPDARVYLQIGALAQEAHRGLAEIACHENFPEEGRGMRDTPIGLQGDTDLDGIAGSREIGRVRGVVA